MTDIFGDHLRMRAQDHFLSVVLSKLLNLRLEPAEVAVPDLKVVVC